MAKKIAVALRKGGSGKTTTAVNLAEALRQKKQKVLLVDLDPQANATISVGLDPTKLDKHINTLLTDIQTKVEDVIASSEFGLSILPGHPDLAETEGGMKATQIGLLKSLLEPIEDDYDYIIMDTPPSESYLTVNALMYADEVLIPLQAHYLAMKGLEDMLKEIIKVKQGLNPKLRIAGILPTMVSRRTNIAQTVLDSVRKAYGEFLYPWEISFSIRHTEASLAGLPIVLYEPGHQGSEVYLKLAESMIKGHKN
ncbi:hypothetical protein COW99_05845 [Candidatus Roizmanbacteria bacterium CG22_combo_CG10-13_8_21_14_all_38_20]|uniref:AAA domain-containing protein n=1 Tax=Candidatus Roizmanbacteria bacterium CG22_combo_CG10-13_8_21_14_all_38_20 TaxID=1974862 RepID=A0A2H0BTV2_9BACT|nr:MAG: hypothetical protein COW99_05845 [Candidatus Roizmanbacteria bacterium CG22_combo_CG10-13_8_21_14_all_38_20]PJC32218.1 MAG: hypothetical protein CO050_00565 [Candidatus Roizmanbacteria bacterium CG_4_9_14_0_2_um_filter_38_17]